MVPDPVFLSRSGSGFQISLDPDPDPVQHPNSGCGSRCKKKSAESSLKVIN